jgi:nucleotide-binding universal stress UspA family protein
MTTSIFQSLLCPVDFGDSSIQGLRYASAAAQCQDACLNVLHAYRFSPPPFFTKSQIDELDRQRRGFRAEARRRLEELIAVTVETDSVTVGVSVIEAPPVEGILDTAEELQSDLIVMGTHGRSGTDLLMLGSVTEHVLRTAQIPVLAVRGGVSRAEVPPRRLLCAVNNTPLAVHSLKIAMGIAECFEASLTVLHVRKAGAKYPIDDLRAWIPDNQLLHCQVGEVPGNGSIAGEIIRVAIESDSDLVVIGAHHRRFLEATVLGTITERVVRHGPCPVLVVPSAEEGERSRR